MQPLVILRWNECNLCFHFQTSQPSWNSKYKRILCSKTNWYCLVSYNYVHKYVLLEVHFFIIYLDNHLRNADQRNSHRAGPNDSTGCIKKKLDTFINYFLRILHRKSTSNNTFQTVMLLEITVYPYKVIISEYSEFYAI